MRNNLMKRLYVILFCFVPGLSMAQATVGDLSKVLGETLILKARANREAAQAELDARFRGGGGCAESGLPSVKSVYGVRDTLVATFVYPNGTTIEAKVGDRLNGGYTVTKIAVDKVVLTKNKKAIHLGFSATPPVYAPPAVSAPTSGLPDAGMPQPVVPPLR